MNGAAPVWARKTRSDGRDADEFRIGWRPGRWRHRRAAVETDRVESLTVTESARPVTMICGAGPPPIRSQGNAPASRGSSAMRANWSGTTASVVIAVELPWRTSTTGVATVPDGSAARTPWRSGVHVGRAT